MTEVVEKLQEARALIERGWCKFASAKTAHGNHVDPTSEYAVSWCAYGAITRVEPDSNEAFVALLMRLELPAEWDDENAIGDYNDDVRTTKEDILALFDRAIAKARGE
jgi:hypothetical protein